MKPIHCLGIFVAALSGCAFSVQPILTKDDLTRDLDLSGIWTQQPPPDAKPDFEPIKISLEGYDENTSYDAIYQNAKQEFDLRVGKIGEQRYLQFIRTDLLLGDDAPVLAKLPVYGFARFELKGDELHVFPTHTQGLQKVHKLLQKHDVAFRDYRSTDMLYWCIITDRTSVLQKLVRDHGDELFQEQPYVFRRDQKPPGARSDRSSATSP